MNSDLTVEDCGIECKSENEEGFTNLADEKRRIQKKEGQILVQELENVIDKDVREIGGLLLKHIDHTQEQPELSNVIICLSQCVVDEVLREKIIDLFAYAKYSRRLARNYSNKWEDTKSYFQ